MQNLRPTVKRDLSLFSIISWQKGYTKYLKENQDFWYDVIFHYDGEKVNFYHRLSDFDFFKKSITEKLLSNKELFEKLNTFFQKDVNELKNLFENLSLKDSEKISDLIGKIMSLYIFIVSDSFVGRQPNAWESRHLSEGILYSVDEKIEILLKQLLNQNGLDEELAHFLTPEEVVFILDHNFDKLDLVSIVSRKNGYILFNNELLTKPTFDEFCLKNQLTNPENDTVVQKTSLEIKGSVACGGFSIGRAKIIITKNDFEKINTGDILVSIMTNASFTPLLNKVSAIVTDEGGITCHAAIISRELNIPCITGTKNATKLIKDNDIVIVDANTGDIILSTEKDLQIFLKNKK
ncbi:MAG: PEP-utilizing enzyme [Patescibacteria group bacterium]